jgi:hypothetical protein
VVREQGGGKNTLTFSYRIVARRKNLKDTRLPKLTVAPAMNKQPPIPERDKQPK